MKTFPSFFFFPFPVSVFFLSSQNKSCLQSFKIKKVPKHLIVSWKLHLEGVVTKKEKDGDLGNLNCLKLKAFFLVQLIQYVVRNN